MLYSPVLKKLRDRSPFRLQWRNGLLLRSTNWLGDAVMTLPAAYQLGLAMPEACGFFVLCPAFLAPLWSACPWVDAVLPMKDRHVSREEAAEAGRLMPGVAVVFPNSFGSAMDVFKCHVPQRVGRAGRWRGMLLTHRIEEWPRTKGPGDCHQLSYYLDLVSAITPVRLSPSYPELRTDSSLAEALGVRGDGWLAIAPGAAFGPAKQWPPESFLEVARWHASQGGRVVFVGTSKEAPVTAELASRLPGSLDLAGKTGLAQLMAVLAASSFAVANDSGAMHLAAAVGTPGVGIFGSTDPVATGPVGTPWRLVVSPAECRPCLRRQCRLTDGPYRCLREITPESVIGELEQIKIP